MNVVIDQPLKRARIEVGPAITVKTYHDPLHACNEIDWYRKVGTLYAPELIDYDLSRGRLVMRTGLPVQHSRAAELHAMLRDMEDRGIHHRDVWPGNLVTIDGGLYLIDWETAIQVMNPMRPSYDLHGPERSRLAVPDIHAAIRSPRSPNGYQMWWGANHPCSIKSMWRAHVPDVE